VKAHQALADLSGAHKILWATDYPATPTFFLPRRTEMIMDRMGRAVGEDQSPCHGRGAWGIVTGY